MMTRQIFPILIIILTSCNKLKEKHYKTSDLTTGGFMDVQLDLNADNSLKLMRINQRVVSENEAGASYEPDTLLVAGIWSVSKDKIRCEINESEEFIGKAFFKSEFKTIDILWNYNEVV